MLRLFNFTVKRILKLPNAKLNVIIFLHSNVQYYATHKKMHLKNLDYYKRTTNPVEILSSADRQVINQLRVAEVIKNKLRVQRSVNFS